MMTSNVNERLTEFANTLSCDQAAVLNYLGREVTKLTPNDLPTLQKIAGFFTHAPEPAQRELNYYIDRVKQGEAAYPYWIEKLRHLPESEKESDAYLQEIFEAHGPVIDEKVDTQMRALIIEGLKSCGIKDQVLLAKIIISFSQGRVVIYASQFNFNESGALQLLGKAAAKHSSTYATYFLETFPACDEACRLKMAKVGLQAYPSLFCKHLVSFGLKEQTSLDELALLCSRSQRSDIVQYIHKFGDLKSQVVKEIIKNCISSFNDVLTCLLPFINSSKVLDPAEKKGDRFVLCAEDTLFHRLHCPFLQ